MSSVEGNFGYKLNETLDSYLVEKCVWLIDTSQYGANSLEFKVLQSGLRSTDSITIHPISLDDGTIGSSKQIVMYVITKYLFIISQ